MPLVLPFPAIDPVLVEIGPFAVRWYALAYIAGILIGWAYMRAIVRDDALWGATPRPGLADIDDFIMWGTIGVVVGGRLGYVLAYNPAYFLANPGEIPILWEGGMSFHGGFLGVVVAMMLFARARKLSILTLFDTVATATPFGLFFGRLANFINGELWGRPTDVPWAFVFPGAGPEPRHPSQLYEAALEGVLLFLVLRLLTHRFGRLRRPGFLAGAFAFGYGLARIFVEFFRMPDVQVGFLAGGLTMGMALSLPMLAFGAWLMLRARAPAEEGRIATAAGPATPSGR